MKIPQNVTAENILLGALMNDPFLIPKAMNTIQAEDFYNAFNKKTFTAILEGYEKNSGTDTFSISDKIGEPLKLLDKSDVSRNIVIGDNIRPQLHQIKDSARRREIVYACMQSAKAAQSGDTDESLKLLDAVISKSDGDTPYQTPQTLVPDVIEMIEGIAKGDESITGIRTGWDRLDAIIDGFKRSEVSFISGATKIGKTNFVLNLIRQWSYIRHLKGAIFSYEMSNKYLLFRQLLNLSGVYSSTVKSGKINSSQADRWEQIVRAGEYMVNKPLYLFDVMAIGVDDILRKARMIQRAHGLDYIVIDHLHMISEKTSSSRVAEIGYICKEIKKYSKILDVPIVCLAQLNRNFEGRPDKRPHYSDLRDSGEIEQIAGLILLLHCEGLYNPEKDKDIIELIVELNRFGSTGSVPFHYDREVMRYTEKKKSCP